MRTCSWLIGTMATVSTLTLAAATFGGVCGGGNNDCCMPSAEGSPGCSDVDCCNAVCAFDAFCCTVLWDSICAAEAAGACAMCSGNCTVNCTVATLDEGEICGDDNNGGCNNPFGLVNFVDVGDIVCGTYWADGSFRDTDWFEFTLLENRILTFTVSGELQTNLFVVTANCPPTVIGFAAGAPGSCDPVSIPDKCLLAGTYRAVVLPALFNGSPCSDPAKKYLFSVIDTGQTCVGAQNDTCDAATPIGEGDTSFDTSTAFTDGDPLPDECLSFGSTIIFNDVWYRFTATQTSLYEISTCNQAIFDTRLAVYTGPCASLALVGCNDDGDGCAGFTAKLLTSLEAGTEYWVRLGGYAEGGGSGTLSVTAVQGCDVSCPPDVHVEAELCGEDLNGGCNGAPVGLSSCCYANGGTGCDDAACQTAVCDVDLFCCSVEWDGICAAEAASICGTLCDAVGAYPYEDVNVGQTICGTFWAADNFRDTDWYRFHLDTDATVTLTVNSTLIVTIGLLATDCPPTVYAIDGTQSCGATVTGCLPPGDAVAFVALANFTFPPCGDDPLNQYTALLTAGGTCAPGNDECPGAPTIFDGDTPFSTEGATTSEPPLDASCDKGFGLALVKDIWFNYTATCTGTASFSTCSLVDYDSRLALYIGPCDNLTLIACNDDGPDCPGFSSLMEADVTQGQLYHLRVGGFSGGGSGFIHVDCGGGGGGPPANDLCANATVVTAGSQSFSTINATGVAQMDPSACTFFGSSMIFNDVWFRYTSTGDSQIAIDTCNSASFDTRIAVFSDCSLGQTIACNDDESGCGLTSSLSFQGVCGTTYWISVGAYSASGYGAGILHISQDATCVQACLGDLDGNNQVDASDLAILLGQWGGPGSGDVDGSGAVGAPDLAILLGAWGQCP